MKEKKWTEGPWDLAPRVAQYTLASLSERAKLEAAGLPTLFNMVSVGTESAQVAAVPMDESSIENAHLIAAAPELYEALEKAEESLLFAIRELDIAPVCVPYDDIELMRDRHEEIINVMAKARGESQ